MWRHTMSKRWAWLVALAAALAALAAGCAKNPVTGEDELVLMSERQELALGAENWPKITQSMNGEPAADPELQEYVTGMGSRLTRHSYRPALPWDFNVVNASEVNAFALPGGKISVTRGLITKMNNEDQLAFVLGHEIGHVDARHSVAQYTRGMLISAVLAGAALAFADEDWAGLALPLAGVAGKLLMLSYSRDQERQADELGHKYMTATGYNPKGSLQVFGIFKSMEKHEPSVIEAWMASHPLTDERIDLAQARIAADPPALTSQPLRTVRFQRALAAQLDRAPAYAAMDQGDEAMGQKNYGAAEASFDKAARMFEREGLFHSKLALARMQQGEIAAALPPAKAGAHLRPDLFMSHMVLGLVYRKAGDHGHALQSFARATKIMPDNPLANVLVANSFDRLGNRAKARLFYQRTYQLAPRSEYGQAAARRAKEIRGY